MTAIGSHKHDAKGRSTSRRKTNGAMKIEGQFIARPIEMNQSPAFRAMSLSAHRVLARVEIEHCSHGGVDNGALPVTFQDFEDYGIDRHAIFPAIQECVALGFLQITEAGRSGNGEWRRANKFRITYLPLRGVRPSHDWRKIETDKEAKRLAATARDKRGHAFGSRRRKSAAPSPQDIDSGGETPTYQTHRSGGETPTYDAPRKCGKPPLLEVVNPHWRPESRGVA
jgi:hypothetical protein